VAADWLELSEEVSLSARIYRGQGKMRNVKSSPDVMSAKLLAWVGDLTHLRFHVVYVIYELFHNRTVQ